MTANLRAHDPVVPFHCGGVGNVVVSLHPVQRRPDPHQHHAALHALLVQDAQHEHET